MGNSFYASRSGLAAVLLSAAEDYLKGLGKTLDRAALARQGSTDLEEVAAEILMLGGDHWPLGAEDL
jgi:hypothetical protein